MLQLVIVAIALIVAVYCTTLMAGFLFKLVFVSAAVAIGVATWRAWQSAS
jgi:hypothetical protein